MSQLVHCHVRAGSSLFDRTRGLAVVKNALYSDMNMGPLIPSGLDRECPSSVGILGAGLSGKENPARVGGWHQRTPEQSALST
jgi:hypothetical protein